MLMRLIITVFLLLSCGVIQADNASLTLSEMAEWKIVVPEDASESEKYAAQEFISIFKQASGFELEQVSRIPDSPGYVLIGQSPEITTDDLGEEGLKIVISPNHIILTGGRPRGVLYGVYEFFEKYLDVQFLTADHTYIPEDINNRQIPCETHSYVPDFIFRWHHLPENDDDSKFATRMRNNTVQKSKKFGGNCGYDLIHHSFHSLLPVDKYGKEHPEYFMMHNGQRALDFKDAGGKGPNPCYASDRAFDIIAKSALDYFEKNPERKNISLSCVDSRAHCECSECSRMNGLHGGTSGSHFDFINRAARIIGKKYPDKFVGSLAYYHTRHAPTNMQMEDNVQIQLCSIECCTHHALDDPNCPENVAFCKDLKDWSKICKNIMIWNYNVNFHYFDLPFPNLKSIGSNVRFFRDNNVKGVFMQSAGGTSRNSSMSDLKNWVTSQCLWKPGSNSWDLALKFCKMHYAESAGPIIEWLSLLHNHVAMSDVHYNCFPSAKDMNLSPEMGIKALKLFKEAMELAKSDAVRSRVEKASICAYRLIIEASPYVRVGDAYKVVLPVGYENTLETYKTLVKKYKTDRPTERATFKEYYKRLEDRKVVTLENEFWKVELLPSWNAKVFNLVYKPLGLKLLDCRFEKRRVRRVWEEQAIKGIKSEMVRDYVLTYQVESQAPGGVILSVVLADGSKMQRKILLDKKNPEKICFKTDFTHNADTPKEYQFKIIPQFYYEGYNEKSDYVSTLVLNQGQYAELKNLMGPKPPVRANVPLNDETKGQLVLFNKRDGFGLQNDYSNLLIEKPRYWWEYCTPRYITASRKLEKGQSMSWEYNLTPIKENPALFKR